MMRHAFPALLALSLAGCDVFAPACTEIGCYSGVSVTFATPPQVAHRVELLVEGDAGESPAAYECTLDGGCPPVFFRDFRRTGSVRVRVTTAAGTTTTEPQSLVYVRTQPNGPDCPPTCFIATVEAALPATST